MEKIELLKKLIFIAESLQKFGKLEFDSILIEINTLLDLNEYIQYSFNVLEIPFELFTPDHEVKNPEVPKEINVSFNIRIDFKIIYFITLILQEIYDDTIDIYINYATNTESEILGILCGTYISSEQNFTNISRPIKAHEILRLNIGDIDIREFSSIFPNNNFSPDGYCSASDYEEDYRENDYINDFLREKSYGKYPGSYAQDVEGLSNDFIDDVLGGEPDAYWNID